MRAGGALRGLILLLLLLRRRQSCQLRYRNSTRIGTLKLRQEVGEKVRFLLLLLLLLFVAAAVVLAAAFGGRCSDRSGRFLVRRCACLSVTAERGRPGTGRLRMPVDQLGYLAEKVTRLLLLRW